MACRHLGSSATAAPCAIRSTVLGSSDRPSRIMADMAPCSQDEDRPGRRRLSSPAGEMLLYTLPHCLFPYALGMPNEIGRLRASAPEHGGGDICRDLPVAERHRQGRSR